jgi:palmitoyl-protein thioesterase
LNESNVLGVAAFPRCTGSKDPATCRIAQFFIGRGIYLDWVQKKVVQAQYFKDPTQLPKYLDSNLFLPDINQERGLNKTYKDHLASLERMVMVMFEKDTIVVPKESAVIFCITS